MNEPLVFLAYARQDRGRAKRIEEALRQKGVRVFSDADLKPGVNWPLTIAEQLREAAAIVVLATQAARESEWVRREIDYGRDSGKPIVPILLEGDPLPGLADVQHVAIGEGEDLPDSLIAAIRGKLRVAEREGGAAAGMLLQALDNRILHEVLSEIQKVLVLLLGNFADPHIDRLLGLQAALEKRGFRGVIFDFNKSKYSDYGETVRLLAGLAGFVIADMSDPRSVVMELQLIAPDLAVPIVPVMSVEQKPVALFTDLLGKYDWVLSPFRYRSVEELLESLDDAIIAPAQRKQEDLRSRKDRTALGQAGVQEPKKAVFRATGPTGWVGS